MVTAVAVVTVVWLQLLQSTSLQTSGIYCACAVLPAIPLLNDAARFLRTLVRERRRCQPVSVTGCQLALAAQ